MKKETKIGIAKWLANGNTGISSEAILQAFLMNEYLPTRWSSPYPSDTSDFYRCYLLIKYAPETFKGVRILANHFQEWKNILKFWEELVIVFENGDNKEYYEFHKAIINEKYANSNYQDRYNERQKRGREIYKKYGFKGKRIPKAPISN